MKKLLLVDGSSYLFRAFHKLPPLTGPKGQPTNAAVGVINMLQKLVREEVPDYVGVVFDKGGETFRHRLFPEYKSNRSKMPEELKVQVPLIFDLVRALGFPLIIVPDVEADDVIATLARRAADKGHSVLISTGDKDLGQLAERNITLINTMENDPNKARVDACAVEAKFHVTPERIPDYLALAGDKSDNIPGVPGVGPKVAAGWIGKYGDLTGVIKHAAEVKGKRGEDLRATLDDLPLYLELATLRYDVETGTNPDDLAVREADTELLRKIYREYGFAKWLKELEGGAGGDNDPGDPGAGITALRVQEAAEIDVVTDASGVARWAERLRGSAHIITDVLLDRNATCVGLALAGDDEVPVYIPLTGEAGAPRLPASDLRQLQPLFDAEPCNKIGHDMKRTRNALASAGIVLSGIADDVMLASYVLNSIAVAHDLPGIARHYLDLTVPDMDEITGKGASRQSLASLETDTLANYMAVRVRTIWAAYRFFKEALAQTPRLYAVYTDIEIPLVPVLSDMERKGVRVDPDVLRRQSEELRVRIEELQSRIYAIAGHEFNLSSPSQLGVVLFEELGMPVLGKTSTGKASTAESVLSELAFDYEVPRLILDYRSLSKLKSTYTDKLIELAGRDKEWRVHTTFHQAVTATGRLSSSDPNLQNIPVRTKEGRRIRRAFIAPSERRLISADYSQIELRVMAHLSGDRGLCGAFERGEDVHIATASEVFSVPVEQVSPAQRRLAKAVNFGLIYGMTPFGLARQTGISRQQAEEYYKIYFERYKGVVKFIEATKTEAKRVGYVETVFGRRLYMSDDIRSKNSFRRQTAERAAINAPMQGTAADLIKRAMIDLRQRLAEMKSDADILLQVHDELVIEAAIDDVESVARQCAECMESVYQLSVPLVADVRTGVHWDEIH